MIFKHPAGEYQHTGHTTTITAPHLDIPYGGSHQPAFLLPHTASDGNGHFTYDPGWAHSMPRVDTRQWAYGQQRQVQGLDPSSDLAGVGWSGNSMGAYLPQEAPSHAQDIRQYEWQQSTTPLTFAEPIPSSASAIPVSGGHYAPVPRYSYSQPRALQTFLSQQSDFSDSYPTSVRTEHEPRASHLEDVPVVPSSTTVKQEPRSPGTPSDHLFLQSRAQLMFV